MVEIEEIEDYYKRGMEELDKDFLGSLSKDIERPKVEKEYHDKVLLLLKNYSEKYKKYREKEKKDDNATVSEEEKIQPLKIKKTILHLSLRDKLSRYIKKNSFSLKIKTRNFIIEITPKCIIRLLIKLKLRIKFMKVNLSNFLANFLEKFHAICDTTKEILKEMQSKIGALLVKTQDNKN